MSDRADRLFVWTSIVLSVLIAIILIRDFENYWLYVAFAGGSIGGAAIFLRWSWTKLRAEYKSYVSFFATLLCFWLVVWFWYIDDYLSDYWMLVFLNSLSCALLTSIFYWRQVREGGWRPYAACLLIALVATSIAFSMVVQVPENSFDDALRFFFVPLETVTFAGVLALIWWAIFRRPVAWWQARRSKVKPQEAPRKAAPPVDRTRKVTPDANRVEPAAGHVARKRRLADLSADERGRIWTCVRSQTDKKVVDVSLFFSIGSKVPMYIDVFEFPSQVVAIAGQLRDCKFSIVRDELLVVEPKSRKVVAIISG